ncbi:unnamed protein product [Phyllotreta striolata]|uniref:Uncharacterized protein n=1 Tax=Phyllotreta striolata TaxID=444603 RepID=A0A9N9TRD5_PHYSR|nr:unnamed protein product [Phyllotreta striolata]
MDQRATDNRSNQKNPNNDAYYSSRGQENPNANSSNMSKADVDNRSRQLNPNNSDYYKSRQN